MEIVNGHICREVRCQGEIPNGNTCNTLLGYEAINDGAVIYKCTRCNKVTSLFFHIPKKFRDEVLDDYEAQRKELQEYRAKKRLKKG